MSRPVIGPKIRDRRQALGITQSGLAARVGISASYLNLIENNKRRIAGLLLRRIGDELGFALEDLDGAAEQRLIGDLVEIASAPPLGDLQLGGTAAGDLASRYPGWARALVTLHRAFRDRDRAVGALADRLSQDPFLGDAVHSLLTRAAAVRSSSEILALTEDLEPVEQRRFAAIIGAESERLADVTQALAAFFAKARTGTRAINPAEEVDDFLFDRNNCFPVLDQVAEGIRRALRVGRECHEQALVDYLAREHSVEVREQHTPYSADGKPVLAAFDADTCTLAISDAVAPATRRFELLRLAADLFHRGEPIDAEIVTTPLLTSPAARARARRVLSSYVAGAVLLPYEAFLQAAVDRRYDIDALGRRFGASFEQVCHRLVTLRRPGLEGIPFGLVRVDAAGFVTKRFPLPDLLLPRYGNACPIWALYAAFQTPGALVRQLAEFPSGDRFLFIARTVEKPRPAFAMPPRFVSIMLACDALHADRTVYADGLDFASSAPATPVGSNCRLCVRRECAYREEDPIIDA